MKRITAFLIVFCFLLPVFGCGAPKGSALDSIRTYRDISGVTAEEIAAVEALKNGRNRLAGREKFTYGALLSTEAFEMPDGSHSGFTVKLCGLLTELFGIPFELKLYGDDWDGLMADLNDTEGGALDFTGELTPTAERALTYKMTMPVAERMLRIFTHRDSNKIQTESDVGGLKLGFLKDTATADEIKRVYHMSFTAAEDIENYDEAAHRLELGVADPAHPDAIDAFVEEATADPAFEGYGFVRSAVFFPLVHAPVSIATANPSLSPVISALNKYLAFGGIDKLHDFYLQGDFEYSKQKLRRSFTEEEKAYLADVTARGGSVPVGFEHDNYPVSFYNEKDRAFQGMATDVLGEIGKLTDIKFSPANEKNTTFKEILQKVKTGEYPMAEQLLYERDREEFFIWSKVPYGSCQYAFISKADYPDLASFQIVRARVGMMESSQKVTIYKEFFPDIENYTLYPTQNACMDALEKGEIDLFFASEYSLLIMSHYREKSGFKVNLRLNTAMKSNFGFNKNETVLCGIVDKAQAFVDVEDIENSWTGRTFDYSKKFSDLRAALMAGFSGVLLLILGVTSFLFVRNLRLGRKLKEAANTDALTGICNRHYFMEQAVIQIDRARRTGDECFMIMYDLDHFKRVNDHHGHQAGDKVLKDIAQRVKKAVRPYDLFGRYGGEEFIILMVGIGQDAILGAVERIRQEICRAPVEFEGKRIPVTASFGIACVASESDLIAAVKVADEALYQAKHEGRNRTVFREEPRNGMSTPKANAFA